MSSGETRKGDRESLELPLRPKESKSTSPSPTSTSGQSFGNTHANLRDPSLLSNVIFSSGTNPNTGISSRTLASPATAPRPVQATGNQPPNLPSRTFSAPAPARNEAFQKAIQYTHNLSDDDKRAFQSATNVIEKLEELQQGKSRTSSSHTTLMHKVQRVLPCFKQFMTSFAICIQHHPEISSLVVGGFNCVLTLAIGYIEFFESLTDMMERIGNHLTYMSKYATGSIAFQCSEEVQKALIATYRDLLDLYVKVRKLFTHKEGKRSYAQSFRLFLKVTWEPFEAHFQSIETKFIHHANMVVRLVCAEHHIHFYDEKLGDRRRKILEWLSPDDFNDIHEGYFRKRCPNTGQWLLNDPHFTSWRDETQSRLLWCYGAPGSGKTILASLVIDHLSARHELSANNGITFIYCSYLRSRSPLEYIRIAIKQLCRRMRPLPLKLDTVYEQHYQNHSQPNFQELQDIFLAIIKQLDSVFLVLDALDECSLDQRADLCEFFGKIVELSNSTDLGVVKLFVASRKEHDIERAFLRRSFPTIEVEARKVDRDIEMYVVAQLEQRLQDGSLILNNILLKDKILTALTTNAGGMFLWVEFQLKAICAQVSDHGIEETLTNIPPDIDTTYERILEMINKKPAAQRELARKALLFIAYARAPASIDVLALAIAASTARCYTQGLDTLRSSISTEETILQACGNLLSIDNTNRNFRRACFVHFSVHEFVTSKRSALLNTMSFGYEIGNREIARTCMIFLLISYSQIHGYCTFTERLFANWYILPELPHHLLAGNLNSLASSDEMVCLTSLFFARGPPLLAPRGLADKSYMNFYTFSPPVLALIFNLPVPYRHLNSPEVYGNKFDERGLSWIHGYFVQVSDDRFAIHYAIGRLNSIAVAERLYNDGHPIDYSYCDSNGPLKTSNTLAEHQLVPDVCRLTPLYLVECEGAARFLLNRGARMNPPIANDGVNGGVPNLLGHVAKRGNTKVIQLLLDHGAEQEKEAQCSTLQSLAYHGHVEALQLLLGHGADINSQGGKYGNALNAAAYIGRVESMQLLLDHGADVNAQGGEHGNALQVAAYTGQVECMQLLLDNGADVNVHGGNHGNALQAAAFMGRLECMRLLLDNGADVNAHGEKYGNALQAAAVMGRVEAMQLLLDNGADVNAQGGSYCSALGAAVFFGRVEAESFLRDRGAC